MARSGEWRREPSPPRPAPGHWLVVVLGEGLPRQEWLNALQEWTSDRPELTIHLDSHIVLFVAGGSVGAELPGVAYPRRPFVPA